MNATTCGTNISEKEKKKILHCTVLYCILLYCMIGILYYYQPELTDQLAT